jgi:hypothetical protein
MRSSAKVIFMLLTLALALPAVVHAQSAGDDQYVDPFENQGGGGGGGGGGNGGGDNGSQTGGSDDGTTSTTAQTTPSDTAGTTAQGTESGEATLPNTGLNLLPVVLIGAFLLGAGITLRRGARLPSPAFAGPRLAGAAPLPVSRPAPFVPHPAPVAARPPAATSPRTGLPAVGLGIVGLFVLSKLLRRRA